MSDKLVVYYSRSGSTRTAAEKLAEYLSCDITEIVPEKNFRGIFGWFAAGRAAVKEQGTEIGKTELNPENYQTVILCTPVWASNIASPVRTWLEDNKGKYNDISYLLTFGGRGLDKAITKLTETGGAPVKTVHFSDFERKSDVWIEKLTAYANEL